MPEQPPGVECFGKKNVTDRFVDQVGEDSPESGKTNQPSIVQVSGECKAQDQAEEEVAGDEHLYYVGGFCRL